MAHAQKPHFVFRLNGRVHLNLRGSQFSRLLAAEVCASALVMVDIPRCEVVWESWLPTPFASFHFTSPPVRHRVPSHSERSIQLTASYYPEPQTAVNKQWRCIGIGLYVLVKYTKHEKFKILQSSQTYQQVDSNYNISGHNGLLKLLRPHVRIHERGLSQEAIDLTTSATLL